MVVTTATAAAHAVSRPRRLTRALAGVAAAAVLAVGASGCSSSTTSAASSPAPSVTVPSYAPIAPSTPSMAERMAAWSAGGGSRLLTSLSGDMGRIGEAGRTVSISGMNSACRTLRDDVEAAQAYSPLPDSQAQSHWSSALALYARSASNCIAGTSRIDASLINQGTREMTQATDYLMKVSDRINEINSSA